MLSPAPSSKKLKNTVVFHASGPQHKPVLAREREARLNVRALPQALQTLIRGINFTAIKSMVPCTVQQVQTRHVVFGRACGAASTTSNTY